MLELVSRDISPISTDGGQYCPRAKVALKQPFCPAGNKPGPSSVGVCSATPTTTWLLLRAPRWQNTLSIGFFVIIGVLGGVVKYPRKNRTTGKRLGTSYVIRGWREEAMSEGEERERRGIRSRICSRLDGQSLARTTSTLLAPIQMQHQLFRTQSSDQKMTPSPFSHFLFTITTSALGSMQIVTSVKIATSVKSALVLWCWWRRYNSIICVYTSPEFRFIDYRPLQN
jgi:hypothetical protein